MRVLVLMCGVMCSGKSTFVKEHGLENYTICPDTIRTMVSGTHLDVDGKDGIMYSQDMEKKTWDIVKDMVRNRLELGSFTVLDATNNFTRNAFYNAVWDNLTQKARGLYINTNTHEVVARGFDKFFNIGERPHTEIMDLADTMTYPVTVYKKENGFLGLIGYDKESDSLIMTSKSQLDGDFAKLVWDNVRNKVGDDGIERINDFVKENRCTLAVEVCDKDNDPHIIEYDNSDVYLLAVIQNDIIYKDTEYGELVRIAENLGLNYKKKFAVLNNRSDFLDFFEHDYGEIEGL